MSNIQRIENVKQIILQSKQSFESLAKIHGAVNFQREASFAMQSLADNEYLASVAMGNPDSLKRSVLNVAAVGLSLSPVYKYAYLVPRDKKIILDISYKGLIQLAVNTGNIKLVHAELVCKNDIFKLRGLGKEPLHEFEPFADRGDFIGAYCVVKTKDGEIVTTVMAKDEIYKVRDVSQSWKSGKQSPWKSFESEMIKKTVIRRAYKMWPLPENNDFEKAINVLNEEDPADFKEVEEIDTTEGVFFLRQALITLGKEEEKYISHLCKAYQRDIKSLEQLTPIEIEKEKISMNQIIDSVRIKNENAATDPQPTQ